MGVVAGGATEFDFEVETDSLLAFDREVEAVVAFVLGDRSPAPANMAG